MMSEPDSDFSMRQSSDSQSSSFTPFFEHLVQSLKSVRSGQSSFDPGD